MAILTLIILCFLTTIVLYSTFRLYSKYKRKSPLQFTNYKKIAKLKSDINTTMENRKDEPYYTQLCKCTKRHLNNNYHATNEIIGTEYSNIMQIDSIFCEMKKNLRILDEFNDFDDRFVYRKVNYKSTFDSSNSIMKLLREKYGEKVVNKYITSFDENYINIKKSDINELVELIELGREYYMNYQMIELSNCLNEIKRMDNELIMKLTEPIRLRDKFIHAEDTVAQLESELTNTAGSLYHKVFNTIRDNDVHKDILTMWNSIKQNINNFNKNRIIEMDIIDSNIRIGTLVNNLTSLDVVVNNYINSEKENVMTISEKINI